MQFVADGPDIPDALLLAHEEGRVVFFCGAGISSPAGLPGFKGLVKSIYDNIGSTCSDIEKRTFCNHQYDTTLELLEGRLPNGRLALRRALAKSLQPDLSEPGATDTHTALLHLARNRNGVLRLVTTNFDRIFEDAAKADQQTLPNYSAPMLPIPKNSRWDGLVYLHGRLPEKEDDVAALSRLVITSGDFGLAYLTERWAARFVSDLFQNYVICFVGYSLDDPVMRYMMDALAADRRQGEDAPTAWAFGKCLPGDEKAQREEWAAKGVTPILYHVENNSHELLHRSIQAWGKTYRDGVLGKERIVVEYASARPSVSTQQDDFVGRMLWALCDTSGRPARIFSEFVPAPSLEWLTKAFSDERYMHGDLLRFGVTPYLDLDKKLRFSLINRPSSYLRSPWMTILHQSGSDTEWDSLMYYIARWLLRHLNDPQLIYWIIGKNSGLSNQFSLLVEQQLEEIANLERTGMTEKLEEMREKASNSIPSVAMRKVWNLLLSGHVKNFTQSTALYDWCFRLKREGLSTSMRFALRELLAPKVQIRAPYWRLNKSKTVVDSNILRNIVECELVLNSESVYSTLGNHLRENKQWLISLLRDFEYLLRDALDLLSELEMANELSDRSHWYLPSISEHWQNRKMYDWTFLAESLRDSWEALNEADSKRAAQVAMRWFDEPYPILKRLALHGASLSHSASIDWVTWLIENEGQWLWSVETRREVCRLLVLQGNHLKVEEMRLLEAAVLGGPHRKSFKSDIEEDTFLHIYESGIWLFLSKLQASGATLSKVAQERLNSLSASHPEWKLEAHQREEFSNWMSGSGDPDYEPNTQMDIAPYKWKELAAWLKQSLKKNAPLKRDTWAEVCRTHTKNSVQALRQVAKDNQWPADRWGTALQEWRSTKTIELSWQLAAKLVNKMPEKTLIETSYELSFWLEFSSRSIKKYEEIFLELCVKILELLQKPEPETQDNSRAYISDPVTEAINDPVGNITNALINYWLNNKKPNDGDLLSNSLRQAFTSICNTEIEQYRHGRVLLCTHVISFFRVDQAWTEQYLIPLFSWSNSMEAKSAWGGFLWSPRLYQPLLQTIKQDFLETAAQYNKLGPHKHQFARLLTYISLETMEGFQTKELNTAITSLPQEGLEEVALTVSQALESAGDQHDEYWRNRVAPFWKNFWPKSKHHITAKISDSLADLVINTGSEFPDALHLLENWLNGVKRPYDKLIKLQEAKHCQNFPLDALKFLSIIITENSWFKDELTNCLTEILQAAPQLHKDHCYLRLKSMCSF